MNILITGHSHGLGAALCEQALARGARVFGLSRRRLDLRSDTLRQTSCDLADHAAIVPALELLLARDTALDLVYLNAGVLGRIADLRDTPLAEIGTVMDINVWANKRILDWLAARDRAPTQIILISSGAGVVGNHGWGAYALSKATLNMLAQLYAHEMHDTHLLALAPGLIDTAMQARLREVDTERFPAVRQLQLAHGSTDMPSAATVAARIEHAREALRKLPTGSFADLRKL